MARRDIIILLAKTVAAAAFGGPLAGAGTAASGAIDLIASWLGGGDRDVYAATIDRIGKDLDGLAASEQLDPGMVDQALDEARAKLEAITHIERSINDRGTSGTHTP